MQAKAVMEAGGLVSDDIVLAILKDRMTAPDVAKGIILDGFPRTAGQAAALDALLAMRAGQKVTAAISLEVDDEAMVGRVSGRFTCAACGEGYHDEFKQPATAGTCDKCGGTAFKRRADDNAETVRERLQGLSRPDGTADRPLRGAGRADRIDAMGSIAAIRRRFRPSSQAWRRS
jgi:adenylate kinase